jgi:hypothetical protein
VSLSQGVGQKTLDNVRHRTDADPIFRQPCRFNQEFYMTLVRTLSAIAALTLATMATPTWAAADDQHDSHHPAPTTAVLLAHATTTTPAQGMGTLRGNPGIQTQMKNMHDMHDKMLAAKTPEERNALMAEQIDIMQDGMNMMGGMGPGAMMGKPGDMATRQNMLEQRMEMMQSMMQMMMDRTQSLPMMK